MKLDSRPGEIPYFTKGKKQSSRRIDINDEAQLSFNGEAFFVKIKQINDDKYKGIIIKAGFDPKAHPKLVVNNDIEFGKNNIFCVVKTGF